MADPCDLKAARIRIVDGVMVGCFGRDFADLVFGLGPIVIAKIAPAQKAPK